MLKACLILLCFCVVMVGLVMGIVHFVESYLANTLSLLNCMIYSAICIVLLVVCLWLFCCLGGIMVLIKSKSDPRPLDLP